VCKSQVLIWPNEIITYARAMNIKPATTGQRTGLLLLSTPAFGGLGKWKMEMGRGSQSCSFLCQRVRVIQFPPDFQHFPFSSGRVAFNLHFAINFNLKGYKGGGWVSGRASAGERSRNGAYHCHTTKPQSPALALVNPSTRTNAGTHPDRSNH